MIIYFNFHKSCIELVRQRNDKEHFAVNFLKKHISSRDFKSIILEAFSSSSDIKPLLMAEKNIVVLPDEIMGFGNLTVPASYFKREENFKIKFNMMYNRDGSLLYDKSIISAGQGVVTYAFCAVKQNVLNEITDGGQSFQGRRS